MNVKIDIKMKVRKLVLLFLVVLGSLDVCAQSVDKNGKALPAITSALQTALDLKANSTSPTFVTPVLGIPISGILTNTTELPLTTGVVGVLPLANGGTGSATKNFVDLTTAQTIGGAKTFNGSLSGNTTGAATISGFSANMNVQTGTAYTLTASDNGKIITLNNASAITLTVPALFAGFNCMVVQLGAGQVTLTASGTTISNRSSYTKTAGANAIVTLIGLTGTTFISAGDMQ
jgi:hypothetical protein